MKIDFHTWKVNVIVSSLIPLFSFIVAPILARGLGPIDRGSYAAVTTIIISVANLLTLGIDAALALTKERGVNYRSIVLIYKNNLVFFVAVSFIITFCILHLIEKISMSIPQILFLSLIPSMLIAFNLFSGWARGNRFFKVLSYFNLLPTIIRTTLILFLGYYNLIDLWIAIIIMLGSNFLSILWVMKSKEFSCKSDSQDELKLRDQAKRISKEGRKFFPISILNTIILKFDLIISVFFITSKDLGLYAVALTIAEIPMIFSRAFRDGYYGLEKDIFLSNLKKTGLMLLVFSLVLALVVPSLISFLFGKAYLESISIAYFLILVSILKSVQEAFEILILRHNLQKFVVFLKLIFIFSFITTLSFLSKKGAIGLALTGIFSYSLISVILILKMVLINKSRKSG